SPGVDLTLRINPGFGHGHSQKTNTGGEQSKHGIWHEQVEECLQVAARHQITVSGLHMHIGSGTDLEHLAQVCQVMDDVARTVGDTLYSISAGGGLPVPYQEDESYIDLGRHFELWDSVRNGLQDDFGHRVNLEIEPGRFLVAESGFLLTEIRAIKRMGENLFYLVDAGFNSLARPILYGAYHPISVVPLDDQPRQEVEVIVGGPLCESGDIFTQQEGGFVSSRRLPEAHVGEYLVLECAGAYGAVMGSNYNSKPHAAEVLVVEGQAELVRRRQSSEDLFRDERIPG
ncbi:MAG: diaminopimelate decarboxylase, partial [Pirellulaceae bacterium]